VSEANLVLFALLGGTALLLYGVRLVGEGLQRAAGTRLRHILSTLTGYRLRALLVGAGVTAVLQSSSATTVMLVGFASAGLLTLRQTIGVILGADVGTTVTVQLLAFDLLELSPLIVFIGWLLYVTSKGTPRYVGQAILGFGFLFLGMKLIRDGTVPLASSALFADLLRSLADQSLLLVLLAAIFTALVRSSAAVIGLTLSLASAGLMPSERSRSSSARTSARRRPRCSPPSARTRKRDGSRRRTPPSRWSAWSSSFHSLGHSRIWCA